MKKYKYGKRYRKTSLIYFSLLASLFYNCAVYAGGSPIASINGAACNFNTIADAIAAAQPNDIINIKAGTHAQLIGEISINLTLVASSGATGCEIGGGIFTTIDGMGQTFDSTGGMVKITNGAKVTFRDMALINASAINGGIMAIVEGSSVTLDSVVIINGSALSAGGNIYVSSDTAIQSSLVLNNGSIIYRGTVIAGDGGGLAIYGSKLLINEGSIGFMGLNEGNTASNYGGGIYAQMSNLVINNLSSQIQNNVANNSGGGIYAVDSSIDINDATVKENTVQNNGGGIYLDNTNLTLKDATVSDNLTTEDVVNSGGGGLYLTGSSHATVDSSTILSNTSFILGGGILSIDSTDSISVINGSDIFNNGARFGAGIFTLSPLLIDNSRVFFNTASHIGGGINCNNCQSLSIVNFSQISHNTASTSGGGVNIISNNDTFVEIKNSTFTGNTLTNISSSFGSGIAQDGGTLLIDTCTISSNSGATNGGGVSLFDLDTVVDSVRIINSHFSNNSTINTGSSFGGGALSLKEIFSAYIAGSEFIDNDSERDGGAIFLFDSNLIIDNSTVSENFANKEGGGIYSENSDLMINNSLITENNSSSFSDIVFLDGSTGGGGIHAMNSNLELINTKVINNVSNDGGGGIFYESDSDNILSIKSLYGVLTGECLPSTLAINGYCSEISNNTATFGAGLKISGLANEQEVTLRGVAINTNTATPAILSVPDSGVSIHLNISNPLGTEVTLENIIAVENDGVDVNNSIFHIEGDITLNLLSATIANNTGKPILAVDENSTLVVQNSILHQNTAGPQAANNLSFIGLCNNSQSASGAGQSFGPNLGDPQFISTSRGDYRLSSTSPSLDSCSFGALLDIDGNIRPNDNSNYDQGAFEMNADFVVDEVFMDGFE